MNRIIFGIALILCAGLAHGDSTGSINVTTNSTIVIPMADTSTKSLASWVEGTTYDQGAYVKNSLARHYWTSNGGTSTNMPTHLEGDRDYDDGLIWYYMTNAERRQAIMTNEGTNNVRISFGNIDARVGKGYLLLSGSEYFYEGQKSVSAIIESGIGINILGTVEEDL